MNEDELNKKLNLYIDKVELLKRAIDSNRSSLKGWSYIYEKVKANPRMSDEDVLILLTTNFKKDILKKIVMDFAPKMLDKFEETIANQSKDLLILITPQNINNNEN